MKKAPGVQLRQRHYLHAPVGQLAGPCRKVKHAAQAVTRGHAAQGVTRGHAAPTMTSGHEVEQAVCLLRLTPSLLVEVRYLTCCCVCYT